MAGGPALVAALEQGGPEALRRTSHQQASLMVLIALPAAAGLALVAAPLSQLMIGEGLSAEAARVTPWIALGALFSGVTTYYLNHAFTLARRTRRLVAAFGVPALANLVLCLLLIPRFGLDGAVWATAASYAVGLITSYVLMRGCLPLPIPWNALVAVGPRLRRWRLRWFSCRRSAASPSCCSRPRSAPWSTPPARWRSTPAAHAP